MILKAIIEDQEYTLNVPQAVIDGASTFFDKLDRDMDEGWQMSRDWVDNPDRVQRCQIISDKLLTALEKENQKLGMLMAGYILARLPNVESVELDIQGEIQNNVFQFRADAEADAAAPRQPSAPNIGATPGSTPQDGDALMQMPDPAAPGTPSGMSKLDAMAQAGNDVTKVFKVGRGWRFSVYEHGSGTWRDSPTIATEADAERLRDETFKARFEALQR